MNKFWQFRPLENTGITELQLMGDIGSDSEDWWASVTPGEFLRELNECSGDLLLKINSYGGDAYAGQAIYQMLMDHKAKKHCRIDGEILSICASAATLPAMACDSLEISELGTFMIHNPYCMACGDYREMEKTAEALKMVRDQQLSIYARKSGQKEDDIADMMDAETTLSAAEAVEKGFCNCLAGGDGEEGGGEPAERGKVKIFSMSPKAVQQLAGERQKAKEDAEKAAAAERAEREKALENARAQIALANINIDGMA